MTGRICATAALTIWFAATAAAQPPGPARSFEELQGRVRTGDRVYVIDTSGMSTRGAIAAVSKVSLTLTLDGTRREFDASTVRQVDRRRRDSVRNGLLIGIGAGALVGFLAGRGADSPSCPSSGIECGQGALLGAAGGAVWGAVAGLITDALIHKREVIYLAQGEPVEHAVRRPDGH
jgi:hypothetical protein